MLFERITPRAKWYSSFILTIACWLFISFPVAAKVLINEIHYHPVEESTFNPDGSPVLDLSLDVYEFIELRNTDFTSVSLAGWTLSGGIEFTFPATATIKPDEYLVIAKNPARLAAISVYGLNATNLLGPYTGVLSNKGANLKLKNKSGDTIDAAPYSDSFPWPGSADALGADIEWTKLNPMTYQFRGRSLERVSANWPSYDPANWVCSPIPGNPSPGKRNALVRETPAPVVTSIIVSQANNGQRLIRENQQARVECVFSNTNSLSGVKVEYFVENIEVTSEVKKSQSMIASSSLDPRYSALLPTQTNRTVVRYRIRANRGSGEEVVSPRKDDPYGWHSYFVTPTRVGDRPSYDLFISGTSLNKLAANISQSPRRVTAADGSGQPRASWNATEPAIFVADGVVYDVQFRHHGSRYNRNPARRSFKVKFPNYQPFGRLNSMFVTDKTFIFDAGHGVFRAADLPTSLTLQVDWYFNTDTVVQRLQEEEYDEVMLQRFIGDYQRRYPDKNFQDVPGELYKSVGTLEITGEGPYGRGDERNLATSGNWKPIQRYEWTYALQNNGWKGHTSFKNMIDGLWAARGDQPHATDINPPVTSSTPNVAQLREYFATHWDINDTLTYLAVIEWLCPWDDTSQNHFVWQKSNGKWGMLPWDFDAMFGGFSGNTNSIYSGEIGDSANNTRGASYLKDSWFKAYREEYKKRLFLMNHTVLHPENISALGYGQYRAFADARFANVNTQLGLGEFFRPAKPTHLGPWPDQSVITPASLRTSAYAHLSSPAPTHAKTIWTIRTETGSYLQPVFRKESATDLVSLAIPFDSLKAGQRYYWRVEHIDANGHPSFSSAETSFLFGIGGTNRVPIVNIDAVTQWRYEQSGTDFGKTWREAEFNDSNWTSGAPVFALETPAHPEGRTTLLPLRNTAYFRKEFQYSGSTEGAEIALRFLVDDGAVFYLNGQEIHRVRMPAGEPAYATTASSTVVDAVYETTLVLAKGLRVGRNVLAVEVHEAANSLEVPDVVFATSAEIITRDIRLSEVMADNRKAVTNAGQYPDWVELINNTDKSIDLAGMSLSDELDTPAKFVFPAKTMIPPRGYLVVWLDDITEAPGLHAGFSLNNEGQRLTLFDLAEGGYTVRDSIRFGPQAADFSIGRNSGATGTWTLNKPTPGLANEAATPGINTVLKINEWKAPVSGTGWFEIHNSSDAPVELSGLMASDNWQERTKHTFEPLSFLPPRGFLRVDTTGDESNGSTKAPFDLSSSGDEIILFNAQESPLDSVAFGPRFAGVALGRLPDGADVIVPFPVSESPGESNYLPLTSAIINEVIAQTDPPLEDSIEIRNISTNPLAVGGWYLSDDKEVLKKYLIPTTTAPIPAGGYLVFKESQFNKLNDPLNAKIPFALSSVQGDEVVLSAALNQKLTGYRTSVKFGPSEKGISFGQHPTSIGADFTAMREMTLGAQNGLPKVGPVVISEIMYHPQGKGADVAEDPLLEYIELQNSTDTALPLFDPAHPANTWRLRDGVDFNFPANFTLAARAVVLVVPFDPSSNAPMTAFRQKYSFPETMRLFGPYGGRLNNGGESIKLFKPGTPVTVGSKTTVPYILADQVNYDDDAPWPVEADGTGKALIRQSLKLYGNEPLNWKASAPNIGPDGPSDTDGDGMTDDYEQANGLDLTRDDANGDLDQDGMTNLQEFKAGTKANNTADVLRVESLQVAPAVRVTFNGVAGRQYRVERSTSLGDGWSTVKEVGPLAVSGSQQVVDELPRTGETFFYRLVVL